MSANRFLLEKWKRFLAYLSVHAWAAAQRRSVPDRHSYADEELPRSLHASRITQSKGSPLRRSRMRSTRESAADQCSQNCVEEVQVDDRPKASGHLRR